MNLLQRLLWSHETQKITIETEKPSSQTGKHEKIRGGRIRKKKRKDLRRKKQKLSERKSNFETSEKKLSKDAKRHNGRTA